MTEITRENDLIETDEVTEDKIEYPKMVPLAESVKYRKRAQIAEKASEALKKDLNAKEEEKDILQEQLDNTKIENQIMNQLSKAGIKDMEAGLALTKSRLSEDSAIGIDEVVAQIHNEKGYLFNKNNFITPTKTASIKTHVPEGEKVLAETAKKAAASGSRVDLQQYLKIRRNFS